MLKIVRDIFEVGYHWEDVVQCSVYWFWFWGVECDVQYLYLELLVEGQDIIESYGFFKGLAEFTPTCLYWDHNVAVQTVEEVIHGISQDVAGMEETSYLLSSWFSHSYAFVSWVHYPDVFSYFLDLLHFPEREENFLIVHHDLWAEESDQRFYIVSCILQVEAIPAFISRSISHFLYEKSIKDSCSEKLLLWNTKIRETLCDCITDIAINGMLVEFMFFLIKFLF